MMMRGMMFAGLSASVVAIAACSATGSTVADPNADHDTVTTNGALTLDVRDFVSVGGLLFTLPSVGAGAGTVIVENTRYGSLCYYAVEGSVDKAADTLLLHVRFSPRLTTCTAEIRALSYTATIAASAGNYTVIVVHEENNRTDTLRRASVTVH
jgi:hypothetical protein